MSNLTNKELKQIKTALYYYSEYFEDIDIDGILMKLKDNYQRPIINKVKNVEEPHEELGFGD